MITAIEIVFYGSSVGLLWYYVLFFMKFAQHQPSSSRFEKLPKVSVVICAKNEADNLRKFLPEVLAQKYPSFEVVVVDDNSEDQSISFLNDLKKKNSHLKVFEFTEEKVSFGKKQVLEFGIKKSENEILVFTDADCCPASEYWLVEMVNGFANDSEVVLGVGVYEKSKGWLNKFVQLDTLYIAVQYISFALRGFPYMSVGRNVGYKKSLFNKVGGLKKHYDIAGGDDDLFINEIPRSTQFNVVYQPNAQTVSVPKKTFKEFFTQKTRHVSTGLNYNKSNLLLLGLSYCFTTFWYFSIPLMICYTGELYLVLTIVLLKKIILFAIFSRIFSKIGVKELIVLSTFMDILSIFTQLSAYINSLLTKKVKW